MYYLRWIKCLYIIPGYADFIIGSYRSAIVKWMIFVGLFSLPAWLGFWSNPLGIVSSLLLAGTFSVYSLVRDLHPTNNNVRAAVYKQVLLGIIYIACCSCLCMCMLIKSEVFWGYKVFYVPTNSMTPAILPGDFVFVKTRLYNINKGDVILFQHPNHTYNHTLIKRASSMPGEYFNGNLIQTDTWAVLGDNADNSLDSRSLGLIPKASLKGKAVWIAFSTQKHISWLERIGTRL